MGGCSGGRPRELILSFRTSIYSSLSRSLAGPSEVSGFAVSVLVMLTASHFQRASEDAFRARVLRSRLFDQTTSFVSVMKPSLTYSLVGIRLRSEVI